MKRIFHLSLFWHLQGNEEAMPKRLEGTILNRQGVGGFFTFVK